MKICTVLVGVKLQPDQHPKTPVIHKVGGYASGSDISRALHALADSWDGGHAGPTSFSTKLCGIRQKPEILHSDFGSKVPEGGFDPLPDWMNFLLRSAVSKYLGHFPEGLVEFHILIDALDGPALGQCCSTVSYCIFPFQGLLALHKYSTPRWSEARLR
jgi:hypothetical protein